MFFPARILLRVGIFLFIVIGCAALITLSPLEGFFQEARLLGWVEALQGMWWAAIVLVLLYVVFGISGVPSAPLLVAGALFGPVYGTVYNVIGLMTAAAVGFFMARSLGRDFVLHVAKARFYRAERFLTRFGFWPLVQARFLPLPDSVVNFCAALAGVPARTFLLASLVGLLPSTLLHTVFISELIVPQVAESRWLVGVYYLGIFVAFNLMIGGPWLLSQFRRRKRYHYLREQIVQRKTTNRGAGARSVAASVKEL